MEFIIEQACKLKDIVVCLDLYEDISDMDLALKNKIKNKIEHILDDLMNYTVDLVINPRKELSETLEELYILDISEDISEVAYWIIYSLNKNDNMLLSGCYASTMELTKRLVE